MSKKQPMKAKSKWIAWTKEEDQKLLAIENNITAEILLGRTRQACSNHRSKLVRDYGLTSVPTKSYGKEKALKRANEIRKDWKTKGLFEYALPTVTDTAKIILPEILLPEVINKATQPPLQVALKSDNTIFIKVNINDGIKLNDNGEMLFTKFKKLTLSEEE
jgi:hypothetical protein